jgi:hypothetical protein
MVAEILNRLQHNERRLDEILKGANSPAQYPDLQTQLKEMILATIELNSMFRAYVEYQKDVG